MAGEGMAEGKGTEPAIRPARAEDAASVAAIYNHYILETVTSFEEEPLAQEAMESRIHAVAARFPWLVYEEKGEVLGYCYANAWHARPAYRHAVESSIYLRPDATGRRIGTLLYGALLEGLEALPLHRVVGIIALPNPASVALHERLGFQKVGGIPEIGRKFDRWIDVGWWVRALPGPGVA